MEYRILGRTGLKVSEIGFGAEHMDHKPFEEVERIVRTALDRGVNIIDAIPSNITTRSNIGRAIGSKRKDVFLQGHIGSILNDEGQYERSRCLQRTDKHLHDFLDRYNTDYIDFGMIHYVDSEEQYIDSFETDFIDYVLKLKEKGIIRYIGASSHDIAVSTKMVNTGILDMIMFSINPVFDMSYGNYDFEMLWNDTKLNQLQIDPLRAEFYNLCASKGVGITVMKTLGGGRLLNTDTSNLGFSLTIPQCIFYALDRPAVGSVLLGATTLDEMNAGIDYINTTAIERDYISALKNGIPVLTDKCMYCNHCLPCKKGIDIGAVTKYLDIAKVNKGDLVVSHYKSLKANASDCIKCGDCEKRCPFKIKIRENMEEAVALFNS